MLRIKLWLTLMWCIFQEAGASSEEQAISELLSRPTGLTPGGDAALLHFAQEQARRQVELNSLRRQKHFLESSLREAQQNTAQREAELFEQAQLLKVRLSFSRSNWKRTSIFIFFRFFVCKYRIFNRSIFFTMHHLLHIYQILILCEEYDKGASKILNEWSLRTKKNPI